jgi:aspartyl-tRNA(Asn)/glutamyl-tRNA(Gln) amidotransferase subunit B
MRSKEEANDYRYFPDPDLLPVVVDDAFVASVRSALPELPEAKHERFMRDYGLSAYDAGVLTASRELGDFYEATVKAAHGEGKLAANWVMGDLAAFLNKENREISENPVSPAMLGMLVNRIVDKTISGTIAKKVFELMWSGEGDPDTVIAKHGLKQVTDTGAIEKAIAEVMAEIPPQLEQYRAGKDKLFGYFVGQVMKKMQGKASPEQVNTLLKERLAP